MLAYVFWHWRRGDVPPDRYEELQRRFHAVLQAAGVPGFLGSRSAAMQGAAWAAGGRDAYEDWYLLEGSAALDPLNDAAVSAARREPHDAAAAAAENGTAGLFRLRLGSPGDAPRTAVWFGKPAGMSYATLLEALAPFVRPAGSALWGRQMTLGPTPEFCLESAQPVRLPPPFVGTVTPRRPIWPAPAS
ncbi:MAG TPA: hypothetical protein VFK09_04420 [Gemmatimonadales bacterium]|jgi:hypothetical protein|nr:hypothetical protein [Gemmatimonadales bacterium]